MTDPKPLTVEELDELTDRVGKGPDEPLYDRSGEETTGRTEMHRLIAAARLSLTLQRRVEEAEAERDALKAWRAALEKKMDPKLLETIVEHPGFVEYGPDEEEPEPLL